MNADDETPILWVREPVGFQAPKRSLQDSCDGTQSKRQRFSEKMPPCLPSLPDKTENEGFDIPTLQLSMKKRFVAIARPVFRRVSDPSVILVEPLLQGMSLEESPAWSMDVEEGRNVPATPKSCPILPRPSFFEPQQQEPGNAATTTPLLSLERRSFEFPETLHLPGLSS